MTDEEIRNLWLHVNDRISELLVQVYALRSLLQEKDLVPAAAIEERIAAIEERIAAVRAQFGEFLRQRLAEQTEQALDADLARLLRDFEGPKQ